MRELFYSFYDAFTSLLIKMFNYSLVANTALLLINTPLNHTMQI
jgi:hypothetical protein